MGAPRFAHDTRIDNLIIRDTLTHTHIPTQFGTPVFQIMTERLSCREANVAPAFKHKSVFSQVEESLALNNIKMFFFERMIVSRRGV